jgi:hypothetical protein
VTLRGEKMPQEPKRPLKVFLCHAHSDQTRVRDLYKGRTSNGKVIIK